MQNLTGVSINELIRSQNKAQEAAIRRSSDLRPKLSMRLEIALDTARTAENPLVISQPFNGFYVEDTTDSSTSIKFSLGGTDKYATDNYTTLKENDAGYSPDEIKSACLFWSAQSGKTISLIFYVGVEFRPGSLLSVITGGVTVNEGTALTQAGLGAAGSASSVAVTTTAKQILASDSSRKVALLYNPGVDLWVGNSGITANVGMYWPSGSSIEIKNTAAIYAIAAAGSSTIVGVVGS